MISILYLKQDPKKATNVAVTFNTLTGPNSATISSTATTGDGVFDWTNRNIELFYIRYLQINGLSLLGWGTYDERHIPARMERPWTGNGVGSGTWTDRPDHNKSYPDIAVPLEAVPTFTIAAGNSQSIWSDIYIPSNAAAGIYTGMVTINEGSAVSYTVPVQLTVRNFALPDVPSSKTMLDVSYGNIAQRYVGNESPSSSADIATVQTVENRHFQMAHRHKISLVDENAGVGDKPAAFWTSVLNGSLYTPANGYSGPGTGVGNDVYSVGTFGKATWQSSESTLWTNIDAWQTWFAGNFPNVLTFLYVSDESSDYAHTQSWAAEMQADTGPGRSLASMATLSLPTAIQRYTVPGLPDEHHGRGRHGDVGQRACNTSLSIRQEVLHVQRASPASGTFMTEDDGVALRELAWGQYKKSIDRWFYWSSTYYDDYQNGRGNIDVFNNAQTFGATPTSDSVLGETTGLYGNGDGVLFYPGTDTVFPASNYSLNGPIASLRLKHWRRGIQDVDYLTLAEKINPTATTAIVNSLVTSVLWEPGVADKSDPTYQHCPIGWTTAPDTWEAARAQLAHIIDGQ